MLEEKNHPLVQFVWMTDRNNILKKIKVVDGKPVSMLSDDRFYRLDEREEAHYLSLLKKTQ